MKIILEKLKMKNFKGFKEKEIHFSNKTKISGMNSTGKTTINDAFTWLLFNKDSNFNSTFSIKPQDEKGNEIHHLETMVEGKLNVNGEKLELKKIYTEKWVKPRGQKEKEFRGNTTDYFYNDVPVKKKEYDKDINNLIKEDIFKLLTDPFYFNNKYHWSKRREVLQKLATEVTDQSVIDKNDNLKKLEKELEKFDSVEDLKKSVNYKIKKYKKEMKEIPTRIDELENNLIDIPEDKKHYQNKLDEAKKSVKSIENKIEKNSTNEENEKIYNEIRKVKNKMQDIENEFYDNNRKNRDKLQKEVNDLNSNIGTKENEINRIEKNIELSKEELEQKNKKRNKLLKEYKEVQKPLDFSDVKTACPTCGQDLPKDEVEKKKVEMKQRYKSNMKQEMKRISKEGKQTKGIIEELGSNIKKNKNDLKNKKEKMAEFKENKNKKEKELSKIKKIIKKGYEPSDKHKELASKLDKLNKKTTEPNKTLIKELKQERSEYQNEIKEMNEMLINFQTNERTQKRISELDQKEKELAQKISNLEEKEYLVEQFNRQKANDVEEIINKEFDYDILQFKLFEEQVNGNLNETCTTMVRNDKGILVPFDSANNSGKINAGLAIIKRLSKYYNFKAPIFIDNAESVNNLYETNSQQIALYVTENDEDLRVRGVE